MRYLLVTFALLVVAGLGWFLLSEAPGHDAPVVGPIAADPVGPGEAEAPDLGAGIVAPAEDRTSVAPLAAGPKVAAAAAPVLEGEEHPWTEQLSGVMGRVLEADGEPATGLMVTLLEISSDTVLATSKVALPKDSIEVGEAKTGADGRFLIEGALPAGFHGLGIDLGGGRATVRFVEESLDFGTLTDIGDIVMSEFGTVFGVVIDDDGEPVKGARVRLAALPEIAVQMGFLDLHGDSLVAVPGDKGLELSDIPAWGIQVLDRLPVSTTYTNGDGEFRMEAVATGRLCGGVDLAGAASTIIPGFELAAGQEHDLDELEVLEGRTAEGRVIDSAGQPVEGVTIFAGALSPLLESGFLQPGPTTGADGRFRAAGVPESGKVVVATRRANYDAWEMAEADVSARGMVLTLPSVSELTIELIDATTGEPLDGAEIALRKIQDLEEYGFVAFMKMMHRQEVSKPAVRAEGEGRYAVSAVADGMWTLIADVPGYGTFEQYFEHGPEEEVQRFEVQRGPVLPYRVVDAVTGEPVHNAYLTLLTSPHGALKALASGWTNENGEATLGPLPTGTAELNEGSHGFSITLDSDTRIVVQHPAYGRSGVEYDAPRPDVDGESPPEPTEIRLFAATSVKGRVTWGGDAPGVRYMVSIESKDHGAAELPRMTISDATGAFTVPNVVPGSYRVELTERFLDGDPVGLFEEGGSFKAMYREDLEVIPGEGPVVLIDLEGDGTAKKGWIEGRVRVDGQPVANAEVLVGRSNAVPLFTDGAGRFRTEELKYGSQYIRVNAPSDEVAPEGKQVKKTLLHSTYVSVPSGRGVELEIDVSFKTIDFVVLDEESLDPVEGASIYCASGSAPRTDTFGRTTLKLRSVASHRRASTRTLSVGDERVAVTAEGFVMQRLQQTSSELAELGEVEVQMTRAVPCEGIVIPPPSDGTAGEVHRVYLVLRKLDVAPGESSGAGWIQVDAAEMTFEQKSLRPGRYEADYGTNLGSGGTVEFELPPGGATDLVLDFSRQ